jgi:hypothetical protein
MIEILSKQQIRISQESNVYWQQKLALI